MKNKGNNLELSSKAVKRATPTQTMSFNMKSSCIFVGSPQFYSPETHGIRKPTVVKTERFFVGSSADSLNEAFGTALLKANEIFPTLGAGQSMTEFGFCVESEGKYNVLAVCGVKNTF